MHRSLTPLPSSHRSDHWHHGSTLRKVWTLESGLFATSGDHGCVVVPVVARSPGSAGGRDQGCPAGGSSLEPITESDEAVVFDGEAAIWMSTLLEPETRSLIVMLPGGPTATGRLCVNSRRTSYASPSNS